jgi:hypothetical protein
MGGWVQIRCPCCGRWANQKNLHGNHDIEVVLVTSYGGLGLKRDRFQPTIEYLDSLLEAIENARRNLTVMRGHVAPGLLPATPSDQRSLQQQLADETGFEPT